jgi:DNA replication protein DnaC
MELTNQTAIDWDKTGRNLERAIKNGDEPSTSKYTNLLAEIELRPDWKQAEKEIKEKTRQDAWARIAATGLQPRFIGMDFDSFIVKTEDQRIPKTAIEDLVARNTTASILLYGSPGTGKTHLAIAAIHAWEIKSPGKAKYQTATGVAQAIRETYGDGNGKSERQVIQDLVNTELLVIDEIGSGLGTDHERTMLNAVFCGRHDMLKPTILISNLMGQALETAVGARIIDRLKEDKGSGSFMMNWPTKRSNR